MAAISGNAGAKGRRAGIFTPEHKQWSEPYDEILEILQPIKKRSSKTEGLIRTTTGGFVDFWSTTDNPLAGRGRKYHVGCMDEAAFSKNNQMTDIWKRAIKPTLLDYAGTFWLFSTPNGIDPDNFFYQAWHDASLGFKQFHAPTASNPYIPADELEKERQTVHPLVWKQEFLAEWVSWDSATFFKLEYFLGPDGLPVEYPNKCDIVFSVMDCAAKSGTDHDATGIVYFAFTSIDHNPRLVVLDYEMHSIDAAMLEHLAPSIMKRTEELAAQCGARHGSGGVFVEDAAGGIVLNQQAAARSWNIHPIPSKLMSKGKDERAMIAGGPAYHGRCKFSRYAFEKVVEWKGRTQNHLVTQATRFRIGDKDAHKREDDLFDDLCYGIALTLVEENAIA